MSIDKIGFGGGCHWCTEGVFISLKGVDKVEQGWIASTAPDDTPSEAVIVHFDKSIIDLKTLIEIHLLTHASTSQHSMRSKYRSAVYTFSNKQNENTANLLAVLSGQFELPLVTKVLPCISFKQSEEKYQDYFMKNKEKPFCQTYIIPKLKLLMREHGSYLTTNR